MNIDEMTGKQLGIAAAGEVMGWHLWDYEPIDFFVRDYDGPWPVFLSDLPDWLCVYEEGSVLTRHWAPWKDMNDAWGVVEKLRTLSIAVVVSTMGPRAETSAHTVYSGRPSALVWSETAPLAILRAVLKAVGTK